MTNHTIRLPTDSSNMNDWVVAVVLHPDLPWDLMTDLDASSIRCRMSILCSCDLLITTATVIGVESIDLWWERKYINFMKKGKVTIRIGSDRLTITLP